MEEEVDGVVEGVVESPISLPANDPSDDPYEGVKFGGEYESAELPVIGAMPARAAPWP